MNEKVRKLLREVERKGGNVVISSDVPDEILETFLREVLACPCCASASRTVRAPGAHRPRIIDEARSRVVVKRGMLKRRS